MRSPFDRDDERSVARMFDRDSLAHDIARERRGRLLTQILLLATVLTWLARAVRSQAGPCRGWMGATFLLASLLVMAQGSTSRLRLLLFARRLQSEWEARRRSVVG